MTVPSINLEMMLAGWQESHSGGAKLTFWLPDGDSLEPFKAMTSKKGGTAGQRFMAVLVMLGDDETPQPVPQKETAAKSKLGPLAMLAVQLCKNAEFTQWIRPIYDRSLGGDGNGWGDVTPEFDFGGSLERWTRHAILVLCQVDSRRDLDTDPRSAARFETLIRKPWMESQR